MLLNQTQFGVAVGISKQMVSKLIRNGTIEKTGTKIDTETELNKLFINSEPKKKSAYYRYKKKNEEPSQGDNKPKSSSKKPKKKQTPSKKSSKKPESPDSSTEKGDGEVEAPSSNKLSPADISYNTRLAKMKKEQEQYIKAALDNLKTRNSLADRKVLKFIIERFLNHFTTGISRVSSTALTDISKDILAEGKCENFHYKKFEDACFELVDTAKSKMIDDIKKAEI
jgi:molecular chaperone GrpE (heat shock protein)